MTIDDIFEFRRQGRVEEAYEAARSLYAVDKGPHASTAMYLTASDMLQQYVADGCLTEADRIRQALERLLTRTPEHLILGIWGEQTAVAYLNDKGYTILERDWHSGHRDIDIIAIDEDCLVFVEVKTRRNREFVEPETAINYKKIKNLRMAINHYVNYRKYNDVWRFDVVTVIGNPSDLSPEINHILDFTL